MKHLLIFASLYLCIYYVNYYGNNAKKILLLCVYTKTYKIIIQTSRKNIESPNKIQKDDTNKQ